MQLSFFSKNDLRSIKTFSHGGVALKKRRKIARPLLPGKITHVVFKSSKATGRLSFYTHKKVVSALLKEKSKKFAIDILDWVNMGNHLHLKVRFRDRKRMGQFLKSFAGTLARMITGARKGHRFGKFWDGLAYTRVLQNKLDEVSLRTYFDGKQRKFELAFRDQDFFLKRFNQFLYRLRQRKAWPRTV